MSDEDEKLQCPSSTRKDVYRITWPPNTQLLNGASQIVTPFFSPRLSMAYTCRFFRSISNSQQKRKKKETELFTLNACERPKQRPTLYSASPADRFCFFGGHFFFFFIHQETLPRGLDDLLSRTLALKCGRGLAKEKRRKCVK